MNDTEYLRKMDEIKEFYGSKEALELLKVVRTERHYGLRDAVAYVWVRMLEEKGTKKPKGVTFIFQYKKTSVGSIEVVVFTGCNPAGSQMFPIGTIIEPESVNPLVCIPRPLGANAIAQLLLDIQNKVHLKQVSQ